MKRARQCARLVKAVVRRFSSSHLSSFQCRLVYFKSILLRLLRLTPPSGGRFCGCNRDLKWRCGKTRSPPALITASAGLLGQVYPLILRNSCLVLLKFQPYLHFLELQNANIELPKLASIVMICSFSIKLL